MILLVQLNNEGIPMTDMGFHAIDSARYQNWFMRNREEVVLGTDISYQKFSSIVGPKLGNFSIAEAIPIGTIEFVEEHLKRYHNKECIKPINIPPELRKRSMLHRDIYIMRPKEIYELLQNNKYDQLFIKSNTKCKKYSNIIDRFSTLTKFSKRYLPEDEYFVSEYVDMDAEWRVFVYHNEIKDIRMYLGEWYDTPSRAFIEKVVKAYKNCPPAYALDVARLKSGKMAVIEVHNFISCGLYGFTDYRVIGNMIKSAYRYEIGIRPKTTK